MKFAPLHDIKTERLILRKMRLADAKDYYERLSSREAVTRYMLFNPHADFSESVESVQKVLQRYKTGRCYRWAIALQEDDSLIGIVELLRFDEEQNTCSFAYMIGDDFWGNGYGTETLKATFSFAFGEMELAAVEADHMAANPASGRAMQKAGMSYVRTEKGKYQKNGVTYDAPVYRITAEDWK